MRSPTEDGKAGVRNDPEERPLAGPIHIELDDIDSPVTAGLVSPLDIVGPEDSPIKVTFRTRDGTRSPYLTPLHPHPSADLEFIPGKPYAYSYSGTSSPAVASTPNQPTPRFPTFTGLAERREPSSPSAAAARPPDPPPDEREAPPSAPAPELPEGVVHRGLHGRCRFIAFPASPALENAGGGGANHAARPSAEGGGAGGSSPYTLFIGQVRFETTPAELLWMIHRVSGACVCHLESRGAGCYIIHCRSETDLHLIRGIHKRVLFDIGGVWFARTGEEIDALCEYVALEVPVLSRKAHLPRDSMVIEEHRADASSLSAARHHSMKAEKNPKMLMQYPPSILPQGQDLSAVYPPYIPYSNAYTPSYPPFMSQVVMPRQMDLPPPPPYSS